jgi:hypothetical protein
MPFFTTSTWLISTIAAGAESDSLEMRVLVAQFRLIQRAGSNEFFSTSILPLVMESLRVRE